MWRITGKLSRLRELKRSSDSISGFQALGLRDFHHDLCFLDQVRGFEGQDRGYCSRLMTGLCRNGEFWEMEELVRSKFVVLAKPLRGFGFPGHQRYFASVAEAVSFEDDDEAQGLVQGIVEEDQEGRESDEYGVKEKKDLLEGMIKWKYRCLKKRQAKIETEAWHEAVEEYQELLADMCKQKLAPNIPYIKSLFLGWFEPLRDKIEGEQDLCKRGKHRAAYAPYFDQLPADMMAVITMHKLMAMLMTESEHGSARVVQAACKIGEAIEQEAGIHRFLGRTNRKDAINGKREDEAGTKEKLRKKVTNLMKKQKPHLVREIVSEHDSANAWGQDAQAKVGSRLIELLIETAYIQPPVDQFGDDPVNIRPAFVHTLKNITKDISFCLSTSTF